MVVAQLEIMFMIDSANVNKCFDFTIVVCNTKCMTYLAIAKTIESIVLYADVLDAIKDFDVSSYTFIFRQTVSRFHHILRPNSR